MNCPVCEALMEDDGGDSRQEWNEEFYYCSPCKKRFVLRTDYKEQSALVASQEWQDDRGIPIEGVTI